MREPLSELIGHVSVVGLLRREAPRPAQAYLFTGADGVGKSTLALDFAALLLCPTGGVHEKDCGSCRLVAGLSHPDLIMVEPEGATSLGVDQARAVVRRASLRARPGLRSARWPRLRSLPRSERRPVW